ncbi:MAG: hypothetical protein ACI9KE_003331 [Polyangiales bacterium]|jgi:hypothetical protein
MLGVAVKPQVAAQAQTNRTMLGMKASGPAAVQTNRTMVGQQAVPGANVDYGPDAYVHEGLPKRGGAAKFIAIFLLVGALVAGGVFAGLYLLRGPDVIAVIETSGTGEVLRLEVPGAEVGTKVRFQGEEALLENGSAEFPVGADALQIGDNELNVDVVSAGGEISAATLLLHVAYRVRPDLSALEGDDPKVRIVVDAAIGSAFTLDETAVALDASGHGFTEFELESSTGNTFDRTFHYRIVKPDGGAEEGDVTISIPIAALQIARPSANAVTDRDSIEIAGAVHEEASVSVNGTSVETSEGRFVTSVPLPNVGDHTVSIVARREGRAPRALDLPVRRVESLSVEAREFGADASLTYARVAAGVSTYQGQKVSFVGRVFNAGENTDGPMMQVVVRECPRAQRCPLWINYDGAVPIELNQWVRVYGTLEGEQQYRTADGEVGQSPRMRATIVIPEPTR